MSRRMRASRSGLLFRRSLGCKFAVQERENMITFEKGKVRVLLSIMGQKERREGFLRRRALIAGSQTDSQTTSPSLSLPSAARVVPVFVWEKRAGDASLEVTSGAGPSTDHMACSFSPEKECSRLWDRQAEEGRERGAGNTDSLPQNQERTDKQTLFDLLSRYTPL